MTEIDITQPGYFAILAAACIFTGTVAGGYLYVLLEPYHLDTYRTFLIFSVLFLGAAAVGLTPHLYRYFTEEE